MFNECYELKEIKRINKFNINNEQKNIRFKKNKN